jgi:hypothetical protein
MSHAKSHLIQSARRPRAIAAIVLALASASASAAVGCGSGKDDRGKDKAGAASSESAPMDPGMGDRERAELEAYRQRAVEQEKLKKAQMAAQRSSAQLGMTVDELEASNANLQIALAEAMEGKKRHRVSGGGGRGAGGTEDDGDDGTGGKGGGEGAESSTRAWFPETFLFEPLVVTDASGAATVPVRVPDRLTTWRILALGHSRTGAQGGAVTSFLSTLPTYVDLVVPESLQRGDRVRLPVQLVNTTDKPVPTALTVDVDGATVKAPAGARTIPAQGSLVEYVELTADRPGTIALKVGLRGGDAVVRTIEVLPTGMPVERIRSGTLAAPRTLMIAGQAGADPATDHVRLQAFPGALAILRSELTVCTGRTGVADDAYALYLDGRATALLAALGDAADPVAVRDLEILTTQRAVRDARVLDLDRATLLTEAALAHPGSAVLARLGERAAAYLAQNQRPDGTFGGGDGWTVQRLLVTTAEATRAVAASQDTAAARQRARAVAVRASGVFERYDGQVNDPYTAAALLASGAITGAQVDRLRAKVREGLAADPDGARYLIVPANVVRADGAIPSRAEASALAALALADDPASKAEVADLGATLLGSYDPHDGWGDGRANLVGIRAVVELFRTPITTPVTITLTMDGAPVASGSLAADKLRDVLTLDAPAPAPGLAADHEWKVIAEPAVPGLGYALALESWVPWPSGARAAGLELSLPPAVQGQVGKPVEVALRAVAPAGMPLKVRYALPAGVQVDTPSVEALVASHAITRFVTSDGALDLEVPALAPGGTFAATVRVIPTLAGTLRTSASTIAGGSTTVHVAPSVWTIQ